MQPFTYPLDVVPFSMAGSFLLLTSRNRSGTHRLLYKTSSGRSHTHRDMPFWADEFFELALLQDGQEVPYRAAAQPHRLDLTAPNGDGLTLTFADANTLVFEQRGVRLRLLPVKPYAVHYSSAVETECLIDQPGRGRHQFRSSEAGRVHIALAPPDEHITENTRDARYTVDFHGAGGALRFIPFETPWNEPLPKLEVALAARQTEYQDWESRMPSVPQRYQEAARLGWFLMWSCQTPAEGELTRPAIYMSKFWMNAIWSWDNCFNALAVSRADPHLAWQQLLLFFDHQDAEGILPDQITDLEAVYGFTKPPIYGWTVRKLVDRLGLDASRPYLGALYPGMCRLTEWWYRLRDTDGDGMCQYHHGNDSGWDNATLFDQGSPTEGADLAAHLSLQCEALAFMAQALGKPDEAGAWRGRAHRQLQLLLELGVKEDRFFSPRDGADQAPETQSLLNYIPIELGHRLPPGLLHRLAADLSPGGPFLTRFGLATEAPGSPKYQPDGYWRGPIWAPSTYLIFDGLVDGGETELAETIAERFCDLCVGDPGFWENYDALTGKGLRCPGYSWTAAAFLLMAEYLRETAGQE